MAFSFGGLDGLVERNWDTDVSFNEKNPCFLRRDVGDELLWLLFFAAAFLADSTDVFASPPAITEASNKNDMESLFVLSC